MGMGLVMLGFALMTGDLSLPSVWLTQLFNSDKNAGQRFWGRAFILAGIISFFSPLMVVFSSRPIWLFFLLFLTGLAVKLLFTRLGRSY